LRDFFNIYFKIFFQKQSQKQVWVQLMLFYLHPYSYDIHHLFTTLSTQIETKLYGCAPKACHEITWVLDVLVVDMEVTSCSLQWTFHHQHVISNIKQELLIYNSQLFHIWYTSNIANLKTNALDIIFMKIVTP
jgi:hypothetical protein